MTNAQTNVVLVRNSFVDNHYSIYIQRGGAYWYIADSTIVGDTPFAKVADGVSVIALYKRADDR
jgi:hypothetical protein